MAVREIRKPQRAKPEPKPVEWYPKTKLGKMIRSGQISTIADALNTGLPLREPEIVDMLIPETNDEVLDVNMVQRMTDSGRRVKFVITVAVGNNASIRKAIENAKLNMIGIRRGCGSWECGCKKPHTVPFSVKGKSGSVEITLKPAPQGIGLATGNVAKKILTLAGVEDCWTFTKGKTKTTVNYAKAVFNALEKNAEMRIIPDEIKKVGIKVGSIGTKPETEKLVSSEPQQKEKEEKKSEGK
jgi:small subunit ribosomal protein S5